MLPIMFFSDNKMNVLYFSDRNVCLFLYTSQHFCHSRSSIHLTYPAIHVSLPSNIFASFSSYNERNKIYVYVYIYVHIYKKMKNK